MRTNVVIDDDLMKSALKASGKKNEEGRHRRGAETAGADQGAQGDQKVSGKTQVVRES